MTQHNAGLEDAAASSKPGTSNCGEAFDTRIYTKSASKKQLKNHAIRRTAIRFRGARIARKNQLKLRSRSHPEPRIYNVRRSRPDDHPALASGDITAQYCLTLTRIDGAIRIISEPRVGPFYPWKNTDRWCSRRWRAIENADREYLKEHPPGNPWGDAFRRMRECGL